MHPWLAVLCAVVLGLATPTGRPSIPAAAHASRTALAPVDSAAVHAGAVLAINEFFAEWQRLWRASATRRATMLGIADSREVRLPYLHCHPDAEVGTRVAAGPGATGATENFTRKFAQFSLVESDQSAFATCPSWVLSVDVPDALDERATRDGALVSALRPAAVAARTRLLVALDSAAALLPGSGFLTGQRVRFRLEQGDVDGATRAARDCRAERWWCFALFGYVLERRGEWLPAEATYRAMQLAMPEPMRCAWDDVRDLLAPSEISAFRKLRCEERVALLDTFWWLTDPLVRVDGNERWVAHQSRRVDIALRSALDADERYAWNVRRGGDALARLILRYDWPSFTFWDGPTTDANHSSYLRQRHSPEVDPYTTFEYSIDRVHLVPTWRAVTTPFAATESDWDLAQVAPDGEVDPGWWAAEHFRSPRRLVQLPAGQTVLFRRETQLAVASAHRLRQPLMLRSLEPLAPGDTQPDVPRFDVLLLARRSATQIDTLAQEVAGGGASVVLRGLLASAPALLAIEAMGLGSATLDARTRFAVQPPPTLSAMRPGEIAISDPALLNAAAMPSDQQLPDEALLDHLLGSLVIDRGNRRLGVYWETYGIAPQDTVTIAVSVQGDAPVSGIRRLGMALNVAGDPNRSLAIRWTEPNPQQQTRTLVGSVPVQQRRVLLNLAPLVPGPYLLRVSVERPGGVSVSSQRRIVLLP